MSGRKDMEIFDLWFDETMMPAAKTDEGKPLYNFNVKRIKEIMRKAWKGAWFLKESEIIKLREAKENAEKTLEELKEEKDKYQMTSEKVTSILLQAVQFYSKNNPDLIEQNIYGKKVPLGSHALKTLDKIKRFKEFIEISEEEVITHEETSEKGLQDLLETILDNSDPEQEISQELEQKLTESKTEEVNLEEDEDLSKKEIEFQEKAKKLIEEEKPIERKKFTIKKV